MKNVVLEVVEKGLCSGCGACAAVCPGGALSMRIQENGDLAAWGDAECCLDKCHGCLDVCPFSSGVHDPRPKNTERYRGEPGARYDENIGWHTRCLVGFRNDPALRKASASGGLATWCLETLLAQHQVTRVAVVRQTERSEVGFFEFHAASTVAELRRASGSVYHPVEISRILKEILRNEEDRWAIVGVPCLCAAIRNSRRLEKRVPLVLGLACGMYQNLFYTEMLLAQSGLDRNRVVAIDFRGKAEDVPPSDFRFRGTDHRGPGREIPYHGLPYYLGSNAYFRLGACNFCMDVFAETADACFMDAWLPGYRQDPKGTSLVVLRRRALEGLFHEGARAKEIVIDEVGSEKAVASQRGHVRRKRELIFMRRGLSTPTDSLATRPTLGERLDWWLQQRTQTRSKRAWSRYGHRHGRAAFWLAVADLVFLHGLVKNAARIAALPKRLVRKCGKWLTHET